MAVLFVMYIPLDDDGLESDNLEGVPGSDETDKSGELANGNVAVDGVEKGEARKGVQMEGDRSCATLPRILIKDEDPGGPDSEQDMLKVDSKDHLVRGAQSTPGIDSMAETDQQGEDKPLLPSRRSEPICKSEGLLSAGSVKNLADSKEENVNQSVGKFKVSKAPEGHGVDILMLGTNGSRREAREEPKEHLHDITTEVITLREVML